jgi:hypothetical protein
MRTEILEELAQGNWGFKIRRLVFTRMAKFVTACLILTLLFWLVLLEDYTTLFFLLGAISGFLIFMVMRFLENHFGGGRNKEAFGNSLEVKKLTQLDKTKPKSAIEN